MNSSSLAQPKTLTTAPPRSGKDAAALLVVLALILAAVSYLNTLGYAFVYDDIPQIIQNPRVHTWEHAPRLFVEHVWSQISGQPGNYYRPFFEFWFLVNYSLFGLHTAGWHLTTVLVHLLVTVLVYLLLKRVVGDRLTAAIATVLFAVHPTHIESVAWVSGVTDPLCAAFGVGSLLAYVKYRQEGRRSTMLWSVALYAGAMLVKETAALIPALMLAYDWLLRGERDVAAAFKRYLPFAAAGVAYIAMRQYVLHGMAHPESYPLRDILLTLPTFLWFYVRELIWPIGLSVFHDVPFVTHPTFSNFVLPLLGVVIAFALAIWVSLRSRIAAWACWVVAVLMVPPIVGIYAFIPEDLVHDRYLYLPSIGFSLLLALAIRKWRDQRELFGGPRAQMAVTLILGGLLAAGTAAQNIYWTNDLILYAHAVKYAPRNVIAINHLANEFYKRKNPAVALDLYRQSLEIKPDHWSTHFALGLTQFELGNFEEARAHLQQATLLLPGNADQYYYLGAAEMRLGRFADAENDFRRGLAIFPGFVQLQQALKIALEKQGRTPAGNP